MFAKIRPASPSPQRTAQESGVLHFYAPTLAFETLARSCFSIVSSVQAGWPFGRYISGGGNFPAARHRSIERVVFPYRFAKRGFVK
jgi:hypothetical protein